MFMITKSSIRIMMTIIMKLVPLMPTTPFDRFYAPAPFYLFLAARDALSEIQSLQARGLILLPSNNVVLAETADVHAE